MRLTTLLRFELLSLRWSGALLAGGATLLMFLAVILFVGLGDDDGFDLFLLVSCYFVPSLFGAFACHALVADRAAGFDDSLYTMPLSKPTYFSVRVVVPLVLGLVYLATLLPTLATVSLTVGHGAAPFPSLFSGALILFSSVSIGIACGVFLGEGSPAAATTAAALAILVSALAPPLLLVLPPDAEAALRILHTSPHLLAREAAGLPTFGRAASSPLTSLAGALALGGGLLAASSWRYLRARGISGWASGAPRATLALLFVSALLPGALAGDPARLTAVEGEDERPTLGDVSGAILAPDAPVLRADFHAFPVDGDGALAFGRANARHLVVLLHEPQEASIRNVRIHLSASRDIAISGTPVEMPILEQDGTFAYHRGWPDGSPDGTGPYVRVPIVIEPLEAAWLTHQRYYLTLRVDYEADGRERSVSTTIVEEAEVAGGLPQLALAATPAPLALGALAVRRLRGGFTG